MTLRESVLLQVRAQLGRNGIRLTGSGIDDGGGYFFEVGGVRVSVTNEAIHSAWAAFLGSENIDAKVAVAIGRHAAREIELALLQVSQ